MLSGRSGTILRHLNRLLVAQSAQEQTDAQLLRRFAAQREEAAFAALLSRHGRLVWDVCRHTLNHEHDAEDAFQATFLVLARKAASIRKGESVGSFLYGVAYRTAIKARQNAAARRAREKKSAVVDIQPPADAGLRELQTVLAEEVSRLPAKYRTAFVLCCLEGKSKREAAEELGLKEGTVASRLARARKQLQERLTRRGIVLAAALTTVAVAAGSAPAALVAATLQAAPAFASGQTTTLSAPVAALTEGVLHAMFATKMKLTLFVLTVATLIVAGTAALAQQGFGPRPDAGRTADPRQPDKTTPRDERSRLEGVWKLDTTVNDNDVLTKAVDVPGSSIKDGKIHLNLASLVQQAMKNLEESEREARETRLMADDTQLMQYSIPTGKAAEIAKFFQAIYRKSPGVRIIAVGDVAILVYASVADQSDIAKQINPYQGQLIDIRATEWVDGTFETETDKRPHRLTIKGMWHSKDEPKGAAEKTFHAIYRVEGPILTILLPLPGKEPPADFQLEKGSGQRLFVFHRSAPGDKVGDNQADAKARIFKGHEGTVWTVAVSPDGATIASGSDDGTVRLWDVRSGKELAKIGGGVQEPNGVAAVTFSPDGKLLAVGTADQIVRLYDVRTGKAIRAFDRSKEPTAGVAPLVFSADGKTLLTGTHLVGQMPDNKGAIEFYFPVDATIRAWDVSTGKMVHEFGIPSEGWTTTFSHDGKLVAARYNKDHLQIGVWETNGGKEVRAFLGDFTHGTTTLEFSPDGETLAVGGGNGAVRLLSLKTGKPVGGADVAFASPTKARINAMAFAPDGKQVAAVTADGLVVLLDVVTGKIAATFKGHAGPVVALAFAPDGKHLISGGSDRTVRVWPLANAGKEQDRAEAGGWRVSQTFPGKHKTFIDGVAFSPDGKRFASCDPYQIEVWDVASAKRLAVTAVGADYPWWAFAGFTNDNVPLVLRPDGKAPLGKGTKFALSDAITNKVLVIFKDLWSDGLIGPFALSPDGKLLATTESKRVVLWDATTGEELGTLPGRQQSPIYGLTFSPDGRTLASSSAMAGDQAGEIKLWDVGQRKELRRIGGAANYFKLAFAPDGKTLAADVEAGKAGGVKLFDVATGKEIAFVQQSPTGGRSDGFAIAPDGKTMVVAWRAVADAKPGLVLYDTATAQEIGRLTPTSERTSALAFSPDGKLLATGDNADTVRWWVQTRLEK